MQIDVPEGWQLYAWTTQEWARLVAAPDAERAYEAVIRFRMDELGQTREEAEGWFEEGDRLEELWLPRSIISA